MVAAIHRSTIAAVAEKHQGAASLDSKRAVHSSNIYSGQPDSLSFKEV